MKISIDSHKLWANILFVAIYKIWAFVRVISLFRVLKSFNKYLELYTLEKNIDIWKLNPSHPFKQIDILWLKEIGKNLDNQTKLINYLPKINQRSSNKEAIKIGITFWKDIKVLIEFDQQEISNLSSIDDCINFYTQKLYKVDQSIRFLYTEFIDDESVLCYYQEYYKNLMNLFFPFIRRYILAA